VRPWQKRIPLNVDDFYTEAKNVFANGTPRVTATPCTVRGHSGRAKIIVSRFDRRMAFVPEGQADRSQARSAWVTMQRGPVPEGRSKSFLMIACIQSKPRSVQSSRWDGVIFLMIPGTPCLATIVLSLRDKTIVHPSASPEGVLKISNSRVRRVTNVQSGVPLN
jgi:hypothetical protein